MERFQLGCIGNISMANLKNTTIDDTGFLELPSGTTAQRPSNPQAGMIRWNTDDGAAEVYNGAEWGPLAELPISAEGGTESEITVGGQNYRVHTFTSTGTSTFTVNSTGSSDGEVEYLIVAGGGGGGMGGGGAGGLLTGTINVNAQSYSIIVGDGGNKTTNTREFRGTDGENSSAFGQTSIGGGGGGAYGDEGVAVRTGSSGGSGGGGGGLYTDQTNTAGGSGTPGQGNDGGSSESEVNGTAGGGGGAGSAGLDGEPGTGGDGISSSISGTSTIYSGGGGGGSVFGPPGQGGSGGGADGGRYDPFLQADDAQVNTGGGGGGGTSTDFQNAGNGGSGIVIIRYKI